MYTHTANIQYETITKLYGYFFLWKAFFKASALLDDFFVLPAFNLSICSCDSFEEKAGIPLGLLNSLLTGFVAILFRLLVGIIFDIDFVCFDILLTLALFDVAPLVSLIDLSFFCVPFKV